MKMTSLNLTDSELRYFQERKDQTGVPVAVQIRAVLDDYIKSNPLEA